MSRSLWTLVPKAEQAVLPIFHDRIDDPLVGGKLDIFWTAKGLLKITLATDKPLRNASNGSALQEFPRLDALLNGQPVDAADFALALTATPFQLKVWRRIAAIPYGQTITYRQLAEEIGHPTAVRAVGTACGKNPVPRIIPCHRVLATNGGLGGFVWGLAYKQALLTHEQTMRQTIAA